jgi:arsenate reductase
MFFAEKVIAQLANEQDRIPAARKSILHDVISFIESRLATRQPVNLTFICTHNSRRSHIAQVWAQAAAAYFNVPNVHAYSGGTEATAFNPRAVDALKKSAFDIVLTTDGSNPRYAVRYSDEHPAFEVFSKRYDDSKNPSKDFAAIMTCTHADENCPLVTGASARISLPYDDPKDFDGTGVEAQKYVERSLEIGREMLFVFSQIKKS